MTTVRRLIAKHQLTAASIGEKVLFYVGRDELAMMIVPVPSTLNEAF